MMLCAGRAEVFSAGSGCVMGSAWHCKNTTWIAVSKASGLLTRDARRVERKTRLSKARRKTNPKR